MSRIIKFRAYNKDTGMFNVAGEDLQSEEFRLFVPNCVLMQYTGLKDKNGKEIYEGDIVKAYWEGLPDKKINVVEFKLGMFDCHSNFLPMSTDLNCEVIGNI